MGKATTVIGLGVWGLMAGYVYVLWKLWEATLGATAIVPGIANLVLFVILLIVGIFALPAMFVLGLLVIAE